MRILVVDVDKRRAALLVEGLADAGLTDVAMTDGYDDLENRISAVDPDVVLIDIENPSRDVVDQLFRVTARIKRPVAMFVDQSDGETTLRAIRAGVSAYVVDGLRRDRVKPIVEMAIARFNETSALQDRAEKAEIALAERKRIEKAKGVLMRRHNLDEHAAYDRLRDSARRQGKTVAALAQAIIDANQLGV